MKITINQPVEVDLKKIIIDINPRYIGDTDDDDVPTDFPGIDGDNWRASVELETGRIEGWPEGQESRLYAKVCDAGRYSLYANDGSCITTLDGYVPHGVVPGDYGDYIDLDIGPDGVIKNWPSRLDFDDFFEPH